MVIEAVLQHYGAKIFCVDFVDNHWTALWFGLYQWNSQENKYERRENNEILGRSEYITYTDNYSKKEYPIEPTFESIELSAKKLQILEQDASYGTISIEDLYDETKIENMILSIKNGRKNAKK